MPTINDEQTGSITWYWCCGLHRHLKPQTNHLSVLLLTKSWIRRTRQLCYTYLPACRLTNGMYTIFLLYLGVGMGDWCVRGLWCNKSMLMLTVLYVPDAEKLQTFHLSTEASLHAHIFCVRFYARHEANFVREDYLGIVITCATCQGSWS